MGLIALRQSEGDEQYMSGIEYRALEAQVYTRWIQYAKRQCELNGDNWALIDKTWLNKELETLKAEIINFCRPLSQSSTQPEKVLLSWWKDKTGFSSVDTFNIGEVLNRTVIECLEDRPYR
jgi:hypothetical protein